MSKKHFIALADAIRNHNKEVECFNITGRTRMAFNDEQLRTLADFCKSQNPRFNRERWLGYINGECGPNGGKR